MKCKIGGQNLRVFSKAIRLISRISTEVLIIADNNRMKLQSINVHKTTFVEIYFENQFFTSYECIVETKCKLFLKSLILVFRLQNIDRVVNTCTIIMDESMPRIVFEMKCKNGVNQEYFVPYMESTNLVFNSALSQTTPSFKSESKLMSECLHNFSSVTKDITIWLTSDQILFKSYSDDIEQQNIITSFAYKTRDFRNYVFTQDISVTFDLKDLKSFVDFCTFRDQTIECYFQSSGKPIEFKVNSNDFYSAKLMLATHDFPEDAAPVPPVLNSNRNSHQSSSLLCTGDLSVLTVQPFTTSEVPLMTSNTCASNQTNNGMNTNVNETDDPFNDEDNDIIEQIISQMPEFSNDGTNEVPLSGPALKEYHMSVLFSGCDDDDDSPVMSSQDIIVPESDEEL